MTSRRSPHLVMIAMCAVVAILVPAVVPGGASARVERLRPAAVGKASISFDVSGVRGRIVRARLVAGGRSRRVGIAFVRRHPLVKVRAPSSWSRRVRSSSRLRIRVRAGRVNGSRAAGDPRPAPSEPPCGFASAGGGIVPGACWRPYSDASPFNEPIPSDATVHPDSGRIVARLTGWGPPNHLTAGDADTSDDWGRPTYYSSPADPVFELRCTRPWGTCAIEGMRINVPDQARPAAGGDGHLTVVDTDTGWEYDLYDVESKPAGGGTLRFGWGGRTRIDGDGLGSAATASRFGNLAGIIRAQELEAGEIDHALFMVVKCDSGTHVPPAAKSGRSCAALGLPTAGAPPMGARFQLDMSEGQIDALPVPGWKKTILRAMARYGMYVGDTGSQAWAVHAESGSTYTSFGLQDALVAFAERAGVPTYEGDHVFNLRDGVDWGRYLRVVAPGQASP